MRLISWNVNGLRACLNKGFLDFCTLADADVICLQETKMRPEQASFALEGYHRFWNSADKAGYSGTAVFTRREPLAVTYDFGEDIHRHEGRVITAEYEDFFLVCCYTPNSKDQLARLDYRMAWEDDLREYLLELDAKKPVVYCGDLNVAHQGCLDFPMVLRAFLRQDPDRILVGEMRDMATAQIAIQASLTGHLVLSTLHTNDSAGAITRLVDMGCEPFLVAASLEGVLAQRLVHTICPDCRTPYEPSSTILSQLGVSPYELGDKHFFTGRGCDKCSNSGYKGRKGIYELLDINDTLRDMITDRAPSVVLKQKAIEMGMSTLREDGLRNIYDGNTTIEEVLKYT